MVSGNYDSLTERLCAPVPEGMMRVIIISEIADVTGQYQNITSSCQWIIFQPTAVFMKLLMEVRCVLYFHISLLLSC